MDARGRVLVSDQARGTIFVYDGPGPPGGWLTEPPTFGAAGGGPRFADIRSIVSTSGLSIYVLDAGAGKVYSYDLANQSRGTALDLESTIMETRFGRIRSSSLVIDRTGQPVVADLEGDRLLVFNPQWEPSHAIGGPGLASGGFRDPAALAADDRGNIYVADSGNRLIQKLSQAGSFLEEYPMEHAPESIVVSQDGDLFIGDAAGFIAILPAKGGRTLVPPPAAAQGPVHLAIAPDGSRLYASRRTPGEVEVFEIASGGSSP